jgi:hypothetical protein
MSRVPPSSSVPSSTEVYDEVSDHEDSSPEDGEENEQENQQTNQQTNNGNNNKAPPPRPEILVDRTVIHESLIRNAIHRELKYSFDPSRVPLESELDLKDPALNTLVLSFRGIYAIENLESFTQLTKLQLDNNQIERICGLNCLKNLTWLDLSFNKIEKIEGLEELNQLTDLSLANNKIERLEGLERLKRLLVLSVGNNRINDLNAIKSLRSFKHLRMLNLRGNPVSQLDDYHNTVFAYLTTLKYLDYVMIEQSQFARARDAKLDVLLLLEQKEKQEQEEEKNKTNKRIEEEKLIAANLEGMSNLFVDMISADSEHGKVKLLPGYSSLFNQYQWGFQEVISDFCRDILAKSLLKKDEFRAFEAVVKQVNEEAEKDCRMRIGSYDHGKKRIFREWEQWIQGSNNGQRSMEGELQSLKADLTVCIDDLMEIEMLLVERMNSLLDEFERSYMKLVQENVLRIGSCFRSLMEVSNRHLSACYDLSHSLLDRFARDELSVQGQEEVDVRAILSDKDVLNNAISSSHENQDAKILAMEDIVREREENSGKGLIKEWRKKEYLRNRKRVAEIYEFRAREEAAIEEKTDDEQDH